jgi:putative transposase
MCRIMDLSRSGFYHWLKRPESLRKQEDRSLGKQVKIIHKRSRGTYGARRIKRDLAAEGKRVGRPRITRLMRENNLKSKVRKRFKTTTDSNHNLPVAPNLLERNFKVDKPDTVYVSDITYIPTKEGWLYLTVFIDLFSRMVVGWSMSNRITANMVNDALIMAIWKRKPAKGLMVHSDRGSQYASKIFQKTLDNNGFICSMSRKGDCWDNAPSESFFHTIKTELIHQQHYQSRAEAEQDIFEYIEVFYNRQRRHSTIDYLAPLEFDRLYHEAA